MLKQCLQKAIFLTLILPVSTLARTRSLPEDFRNAIGLQEASPEKIFIPTKERNKTKVDLKIYWAELTCQHTENCKKNKIRKLKVRFNLLKKSHFYLESLHLEIQPKKFDPQSLLYTAELTVYTRHGKALDVEEKLGKLNIQGRLKGEKSPYSFSTYAKKTLKDPSRRGGIELTVGSQKNQSPRLSKERNRVRKFRIKEAG